MTQLRIKKHFTLDEHPYDEVKWIRTTAEIPGSKPKFKQENVEFPDFYSQTAINIIASKYFCGALGTPEREYSLKQLINRVVNTNVKWGLEQGYFGDEERMIYEDSFKNDKVEYDYAYATGLPKASLFANELTYLLLHQMFSFNSPVWFNMGNPYANQEFQSSACFTGTVEDNLDSIFSYALVEGRIFKRGSGDGTNLSRIRSSKEAVSGGGVASGPISFAKIYDVVGSATKSGGITRRAAIMRALNIDHGDIRDFIWVKKEEEDKAKALIAAGWSSRFDDPKGAYGSVFFQNGNHSVGTFNSFMEAVKKDEDWALLERKLTCTYAKGCDRRELKLTSQGTFCFGSFDKEDKSWYLRKPWNKGYPENDARDSADCKVIEWTKARDLFNEIAECAWETGDPGLIFLDLINEWLTCKNDGECEVSNPCIRKGERILTLQGWKKIEDLDGQEPLLYNGTIFAPGKVWKTGVKQIVRLTTNTGRTIDVTEDHLIATTEGDIKAKDMLAKKIPYLTPSLHIEGDKIMPKCVTGGSGTYYSSPSKELMETLGFLQGDGSVNLSSKVVSVNYTPEKDNDFLNECVIPVLSDISADTDQEYIPGRMKDKSGYTFCKSKLYNYLNDIGWVFKKLPERSLPEFVFGLNQTALCSFLRGLYGANGNIINNPNRKVVILVSTCKKLLQEVQLLLQTLGINSALRIHNKKHDVVFSNGTYTCKESYHLEITHDVDIFAFSRFINFPQQCQQEKLASIIRTGKALCISTLNYRSMQTVIKVENLGVEDDVYDFTCSSTHYGLINGIYVHNCGEMLYLPDNSCNLGSLRLTKFYKDGVFQIEDFCAAINIAITAMDIWISKAHYPTEKIALETKKHRILGLGYADLGALLLKMALPYDSKEGRDVAAGITALMTMQAYKRSKELAEALTPFERWEANAVPMNNIIWKHSDAIEDWIAKNEHNTDSEAYKIFDKADDIVFRVVNSDEPNSNMIPFRNAQVTCIAPTGTISLMMDCETSGLEPAMDLITYKKLVGGGELKMTIPSVNEGLHKLGYTEQEIEAFVSGKYENRLSNQHKKIFATSIGSNQIPWEGHIKMVAAIQPFLSMGASKTINLSNDATIEDIKKAYMMAYDMKLKGITVYRDGCKSSQPLNSKSESDIKEDIVKSEEEKTVSPADLAFYNDIIVSRQLAKGEMPRPYIPLQRSLRDGGFKEVVGPDMGKRIKETIQEHIQDTALPLSEPAEYTFATSNTLTQLKIDRLRPVRNKLPDTRPALTHKFTIGGHEGYLTIGLYENGDPGEIFVTMSKEGSTISGLMDGWATNMSIMLQYGIPLEVIIGKAENNRFEPNGMTSNPKIRFTSSIIDYIAKFLRMEYLDKPVEVKVPPAAPIALIEGAPKQATVLKTVQREDEYMNLVKVPSPVKKQYDGNACIHCGGLLQKAGTCSVCSQCGETTGCG